MEQHNDFETDPITTEVVRNKLEGIANEMQSTLFRSSFSPIVKEGLDASASLFTIDGETLAQAIALPFHLATLIPIVKKIIEEFQLDQMADKDIYIMNDPYMGGTHLPDIALVMPIFSGGELIAFSAAMTHHQDVGGMSPGSVPTNATEIFQEGIRIPPLKYSDKGVINDTLLKILKLNVRLPASFEGDLNAQIAACEIGRRRISDLEVRYSAKVLKNIFLDLLNRSESMTRQAIMALPDGTHAYFDYLDNDGIDLDTPIKIEVSVRVMGDSVEIDFSGTSQQVRGPFNLMPSGAYAAAYFAVHALTDPNIPTNGGCFRPIKLLLPEKSIVNPEEPAPVNARTSTMKRVAGCITGALGQFVPERAPADAAGEMLLLAFGGDRVDGSRYVVGELIASGSGASEGMDGVDVIETDGTNCMNLPVEALEMDVPIRVHKTELNTGSGGSGKFRGGLGLVREYEILHGTVIFTHRGERHSHPARGLMGGEPGGKAYSKIKRYDGKEIVIKSKTVETLRIGDRISVQTAGGGGYGRPAERPDYLKKNDVADRKTFDH
ncbi:MAG: hydantoinase B/oxoprolinase family protein [Thalassobaculaceae bacterium]